MSHQLVARQCPVCVNTSMRGTSYQGRRVQVCPGCGGLWYEPAPAASARMGAVSQASEAKPAPRTEAGGERPALACPGCQESLTTLEICNSFG